MRSLIIFVLLTLSGSAALAQDTGYNLAGAPVTGCYTYAASPFDPGRIADGVAFQKIKPGLAVPACEKAVEQNPNNIRLLYQLGRAYQKKGNLGSALEQYRRAAEQGYIPAQYNLGVTYEKGLGVTKDEVKAVAWFRRAAEQGDAGAQFNLGRMYQGGLGVLHDDAQAVAWYTKAALQGFADAQMNLGLMYENGLGLVKDNTQAVAWYRMAADQGSAVAQNRLGFMYQNGLGVVRDATQAVAWYRKAAEQGLADGQANLGFVYQIGLGIAQDEAQAVAWYRKSAEQGLADAQMNLGFMYESGQGVKRDYVQAVAWYRKAAEQDNARAQNALGTMYSLGQGVPQDSAEAANWWRKAAAQGNANAQKHLDNQVLSEREREYKPVKLEDFVLDGNDLAAVSAKVTIKGTYVKWGESELLFPSRAAVFYAKERFSMDGGIGVVSNDATRSARKYLLDCATNMALAQLGCPLTVFARASMCTWTRLGSLKDVPCLIIEDGVAGE